MNVNWVVLIFSCLYSVIVILSIFFMLAMLRDSIESKIATIVTISIMIISMTTVTGLIGFNVISNSFYSEKALSFEIVENSNYGIIEKKDSQITFNVKQDKENSQTQSYIYYGDIQYKKAEGNPHVKCTARTYLFHDNPSEIEDIVIYYK